MYNKKIRFKENDWTTEIEKRKRKFRSTEKSLQLLICTARAMSASIIDVHLHQYMASTEYMKREKVKIYWFRSAWLPLFTDLPAKRRRKKKKWNRKYTLVSLSHIGGISLLLFTIWTVKLIIITFIPFI